MKKIFILMMMLALFDSCVCMRQSMTEPEKLARIERLHMDAALGKSGVDSELFSLTKEFKNRAEEGFYTSRMLYAELVLSGFDREKTGVLPEAIDIFIEIVKKMDIMPSNPLLSQRITWSNPGLRDTLTGDLMQIRTDHRLGKNVAKKEALFKRELIDVLTGKITTIDELIDSESGSSEEG